MTITDSILPDNQYKKETTVKTQIYLHHTAGSHRADRQASYWAKDNLGRVATAYIIGGKSTRDGDESFDGKIYRAFEDKYWGYHLGLKTSQNEALNKGSIGIEICNYGPLKLVNGEYLTYVQSVVPEDMVYKPKEAWRGFKFYHKYTDKQLTATKELLIDIANRHNIDIKKQWNFEKFSLQNMALAGSPGLWTHCQVRSDKFDCSPQDELIDMLNSL